MDKKIPPPFEELLVNLNISSDHVLKIVDWYIKEYCQLQTIKPLSWLNGNIQGTIRISLTDIAKSANKDDGPSNVDPLTID